MLSAQASASVLPRRKKQSSYQGVFFYLEIISPKEPQYERWAKAIFPQCERIMSAKPHLAFFPLDENKFGCIIKYAQKKTAKLKKGPFFLPGDDEEIRFYFPGDSKTFRRSMFEKWAYHTTSQGKETITYQVGEILDPTAIKVMVERQNAHREPSRVKKYGASAESEKEEEGEKPDA